ncbi:macro domain-containing protein [Actinokineospora terrae]|uniref:macro domain-containing protein n=1 Tax=Actinokineospora terrae TaxID=155974 RepID=UPI001160144E|nr:macro domain-containing protein [Actinokineospora terrae]
MRLTPTSGACRTYGTARSVTTGLRALNLPLVLVGLTVAVSTFLSGLWQAWWITAVGIALVAAVFASARRTGQGEVGRQFHTPSIRIRVVVGDLLEQPCQIAVGFSDTFDTDTTGNQVINATSLQGQFLDRRYAGNRHRLDDDLAAALAATAVDRTEQRSDKVLGKLARYPLGTVAVLGSGGSRVYCLAYTTMSNTLVARSTLDSLWTALGLLWDAVAESGQLAPLAVPLIGADLARVDVLDRQHLLQLIAISFLARSRRSRFCRELVLVVHPKDAAEVDMAVIAAFLHGL